MNLYPMKLIPVSKDIIWGGDLLIREYHKQCDTPRLAESWELTVHEQGMSVIANGEYASMTLSDYLGCGYDFPLLVKFIDAREQLSVQVHPAKTELWYIVEAEEGAQLVYGLKKDFNEAEFRAALAENRLNDLLHYVNVKKGEFYLLPSGLIHAIGAGILIAEFQQNSAVTYRVYDYNRGREIHTEQAIETIKRLGISTYTPGVTENDFFSVKKYSAADGPVTLTANDTFLHILCLDGEGTIGGEPAVKGDSYFLPAGLGQCEIRGNLEYIVTQPKTKS